MISYPAKINGTLTRLMEAGEGDNFVIFTHGVGARGDRWRRNLDPLAAAGFHCISLDLPGHGFAQKGPDFPYGVPAFADLVLGLMDMKGAKKAHLVGTSLGGHISAMVGVKAPDRVKSLTLVGSTGLFPIGQEACNRIAERIVDRNLAGIEGKLKTVMLDPVHATPDFIAEEYAINNSPGSTESFQKLAVYFKEQIDKDAVGEKLAALGDRFPQLLIWGSDDKSVPVAIGEKAAALLKHAPLKIIQQTSHCPYYEKPDEFNAMVIDFLKGR